MVSCDLGLQQGAVLIIKQCLELNAKSPICLPARTNSVMRLVNSVIGQKCCKLARNCQRVAAKLARFRSFPIKDTMVTEEFVSHVQLYMLNLPWTLFSGM
jgi:hypothetical protein